MSTRTWRNSSLAVPAWGLVVTAATALALFPIAQAHDFWLTGLSGAAVVVLTGVATRATRSTRPWTVPAQLVVLLLWASVLIAPREALWGALPTPATGTALIADAQRVLELAQERAAPLPVSPALSIVLALGVAVLGLLVDLFAATVRRAAVVGLVLLAVYMVPVATLSGQVSMHAFWPGALAWVGLLLAAERIGVRRLSDAGPVDDPANAESPANDPATLGSPFDARGRQVGVSAVGIALVLPLLLPAASLRLFGTGGTLGLGGAGAEVISVDNPVLDLRRNLVDQPDVELLRVRTDDPDPSYLRTTVLDEFTGDRWQPSSRDEDDSVDADAGALPPPPGQTSAIGGRDVQYDVTVTSAFSSSWLPVVYAPTSIDVDGDWRIDRNTLDVVVGDQNQAATSTTYSFSARIPDPSADQLRDAPPPPAEEEPLTYLPADLPAEIGAQARAVTRGLSTDYDRAVALERWFRYEGGFVYSTEPRAGTGAATIAAFVTDDRVGYCEQYASAMALMARSIGIPARVAVGFLRPKQVAPDTWSFEGGDLHTWPELYFTGVGWVRFEPTPADRTGGGAANEPGQNQPENKIERNPRGGELTQAPGTSGTPSSIRAVSVQPVSASTEVDGRAVGGLLALVVAGLVPAAWREVRRRRRWARAAAEPAQAPEAAWDELADGVLDLGHPWDRASTPRAAGRALRPLVEGDRRAVDALNRLVRIVERSRFAAASSGGAPPDVVTSARADVDAVLEAVADGCSRSRRQLSRWVPRSLAVSVPSARAWERLRLRHA